jgi:hypothetical protein
MCAFGFKRVEAITDITFGGARYSVCAHHRDNPIANPHRVDVPSGPAPSSGTVTSDRSARQSDKDVTPQCYLVLGVIAAAPQGLTRDEIHQRAQITNQAACARLNALEARGLVVVDGEKRMASTKRTQQVYKLARVAA